MFASTNSGMIDSLPEFVIPPERKYLCVRCNDVLRPPVKQTVCGHRLCGVCIPIIFTEMDSVMCPGQDDCGDCPLRLNEIRPDIATTKELLRMKVYCPFKPDGCDATLQWGTIREHVLCCGYERVRCENEGCHATVLRSELKRHMRYYCGYETPKQDATVLSDDQLCPFKEKTENGQHGETGGAEKDPQANSSSSVDEEAKCLERLLKEAKNLQADLYRLSANGNHTVPSKPVRSVAKHDEALTDMRGNLNNTTDHPNNSDISTETNGLAVESAIANHYARGRPSFHQFDNMYDIRFAEYDIRFRLLETASYDGRLIWKISSYQMRKKDATEGRTTSICSQPFYTSYYGYKMCARVYLNGDGMGHGTHLSLYFVVMRGKYDALLQWPFRQRVTMALLDQSGNRKHVTATLQPGPSSSSFKRPVTEVNIASGYPLFVAQNVVEQSDYLKDGTIVIQIVVKASDDLAI